MTTALFALLIGFFSPNAAFANQCLPMFSLSSEGHITPRTLDQLFTTQPLIGRQHSWQKLLAEVGLPIDLVYSSISKAQRKILVDHVQKKIAEEVIAGVIAPDGRVYVIDGHHRMYSAVLMGLDLSVASIHVRIVKSYFGKTFDFFREDMLAREWSDPESLLFPRLIHDLNDSPARSLIGMAFFALKTRGKIPFAPKHFEPRFQFKLIEFMRDNKLYDFDNLGPYITDQQVMQFATLVLLNRDILKFLLSETIPTANPLLVDFLMRNGGT